jgi:hypothetical protein
MISFAHEARIIFDRSSPTVRTVATPALEFLSSGFEISWFREDSVRLWSAILKPNDVVQKQFGLQKEYFLIGHGYTDDFHQRTLLAEPDTDMAFRLDRRIRFVASAAPQLAASCAGWAAENKISIVPVELASAAAAVAAGAGEEKLFEILRRALWRRDWFADSEPVRTPGEFFGREQYVNELLGRTNNGQPIAVLGLRKIGKTSLLRRAQDLLEADPSSLVVTAFLLCNSTRLKAGHWWTVLSDILTQWATSLEEKAQKLGVKFTPPGIKKLSTLVNEGKYLGDPSRVATAFERDFEKLRAFAQNLAGGGDGRTEKAQVRMVVFLDEADELFPDRKDSNYWKEDFFLLWNTMQTLKRGLDDPKELIYILSAVNPSGVELGSFEGRPNPLFELGQIYLPPMSQGESGELLRGLGAFMGLIFEPDAIIRAHEITGGHPWLLRKLGSRVHDDLIDRASIRRVFAADVNRIFKRTKRDFYAHVDWILRHLELVAPDEFRLLRDVAVKGVGAYAQDWADNDFRDVFAHHLQRYGLLVFIDDVPKLALELIAEALRRPQAPDIAQQRQELRTLVDALESAIRNRLVNDLAKARNLVEVVDAIVDSIPKDAKNRPRSRDELRKVGATAGLRALVDNLNWDDYIILLDKFYEEIQWIGGLEERAARIARLRETVRQIHVVRHNNDTELKELIAAQGFEGVRSRLISALDSLTA